MHLEPRIHTDEHGLEKKGVNCPETVDFNSCFHADLVFSIFFLSVSIRVNPWFQISISKKIAASVPPQGVVLGWNCSAALDDGATGGDERRHIASALHRGSEGAQAISINSDRTTLLAKRSVLWIFPIQLLLCLR
jgi:hypothetical protein